MFITKGISFKIIYYIKKKILKSTRKFICIIR